MKSATTVRNYVIASSLSLSPALFAQPHKAPPTDWQIEAEVQKVLANDPIFVGSSIMSSVNQGVVKLTGNVRSETEKEYASSDLANLPGVKTVLNNLEVYDNSFHPAPTPAKVAGPTGPKTITLAAGTAIPFAWTVKSTPRLPRPVTPSTEPRQAASTSLRLLPSQPRRQ